MQEWYGVKTDSISEEMLEEIIADAHSVGITIEPAGLTRCLKMPEDLDAVTEAYDVLGRLVLAMGKKHFSTILILLASNP